MKLTNDCEFAPEMPTVALSLDRNDFERGYEDDDRFERPRHCLRPASTGSAAHPPPSCAFEDDDTLDETALHFSNQ